jgi:hypothetical protein
MSAGPSGAALLAPAASLVEGDWSPRPGRKSCSACVAQEAKTLAHIHKTWHSLLF